MKNKNIGKYILIIGGIIAIGGIILFLKSQKDIKAAIPDAEPEPAAKKTITDAGDIIIQDYDTTWDYKFSNSRWYTKKKGSDQWLDMKESLSPENYSIAIKRLATFTNK